MCFMPLLPPRSRKLRISRSGLGLAPMMKAKKSPSMSAVDLPLLIEPIRLLSRSRQPTEMSGAPSVRHGASSTSCLGGEVVALELRATGNALGPFALRPSTASAATGATSRRIRARYRVKPIDLSSPHVLGEASPQRS